MSQIFINKKLYHSAVSQVHWMNNHKISNLKRLYPFSYLLWITLCCLLVSKTLCLGFDFEQTEVEEEEPVCVITDTKYRLEGRKSGSLPGFKVASSSDYTIERWLLNFILAF